MNAVFRPMFGRILTVVVASVCAVALVFTIFDGTAGEVAQVLPWLLLVAGGAWAIFWRPGVEVSDGGVRIVNITRTIDVPWPAIQNIETKWALKLVTAYGSFTAWAAPAGGRGPARRASRVELNLLQRARVTEHLAPIGSLEGAAGDAAVMVRDHWTKLRQAGHLDHPVLEHERAPVRWHVETLVIGAVLIGLGVIGASV